MSETTSMTIGHVTFDRVSCDHAGGVLYMRIGEATSAVDFDASPKAPPARRWSLVGLAIVTPAGCSTPKAHPHHRVKRSIVDRDAVSAAMSAA